MKKLISFLTATLLLAANAPAQSSEAPASSKAVAPAPSWDRAGHIRLCEHRGDKHCTLLTIPPGVSKGIVGVVSTKVVPGVTQSFIIAGRKNVYLCASGVSGIVNLRCQKIQPIAPTLDAPATEVAAANLQNTITLLLAPRPTLPPATHRTLGGCDSGGLDEETGEPEPGSECSGTGGGGGGIGDAWSDVPDPDTDTSGGTGSALDIATPWILEALKENEIAFELSGRNFVIDQAQCNTLVARCREDCSDRTTERAASCATVVGLIALGPGWAKAASILVAGACTKSIYNYNATCKSDCTFFACIPQ